METTIDSLIEEIKSLAEKLKIGIDDDVRNDFEYNLFYLNNELAEYEQSYERAQQQLDSDLDAKFRQLRPEQKSDKATEMICNEQLATTIILTSLAKSKIKAYNRIHRGMIRLWDYVTGQKIQANFLIKQQGY